MQQQSKAAQVWKKALVVAVVGVAGTLAACSDSTVAPPRAAVASIIGPGAQAPSVGCGLNSQAVMADPGSVGTNCNNGLGCMGDPDGTTSVENGSGPNVVDCSVTASGAQFAASAVMKVASGNDAGSITLSGTFLSLDKTKPAPQRADVPGTLRVVFTRADTGTFQGSGNDCSAWYTNDRSQPDQSHTLNAGMGVAEGRLWVTVFCPAAKFNDSTSTLHKACQGVATVKLENCTQSGG